MGYYNKSYCNISYNNRREINMEKMPISRLASESGVPRHTIHYYIKKGLLHPPVKTAKTRAYFDQSHLERLRQIKLIKQNVHSTTELIKIQIEATERRKKDASGLPQLAAPRIEGGPRKIPGFHPSKRQRIIEAATQLFSTRGYSRTKVTDITGMLRISTGSFYSFFESKDDLFIHVVGEVVKDTISRAEKVIRKEKDLIRRNIMRAEALNENFTNFSAILTQLRAEAASQRKWGEKNIKQIYDDFTRPIIKEASKAMEQGIIRGVDPDLLAFALIGMCEMLIFRKTLDTQYELDKIINFMLDFVFNGIRPATVESV
jgi:AcrR family transcriptional regulator